MTPQEIERINAICAELDGWKHNAHGTTYNGIKFHYKNTITGCYLRNATHLPSYTRDLNEIFRLVREWIRVNPEMHIFNLRKALEVIDIFGLWSLLDNENPALLMACALVKAAGRWKEVEDVK